MILRFYDGSKGLLLIAMGLADVTQEDLERLSKRQATTLIGRLLGARKKGKGGKGGKKKGSGGEGR